MSDAQHDWKTVLALGLAIMLTGIGIGGCNYLEARAKSKEPLIVITTKP